MEFVGLDKLSILDYEDYISAVIFTPRCNFRCPFCHNGTTILNSQDYIPFEEILSYLESRKGLLDAVVVTGGEPTLMPELKERITQIKKMGFKVKLDTNGTHPEVVKDLLDSNLLDYIAMDVKNSLNMYSKTVGTTFVPDEKILESIALLKSNRVDYEFRTTLVKEFHDEESIKEMANLVKGAKKIYLQKFIDRDGCLCRDLHEVDIDTANKFKKILEESVETVELRGY